MIPVFTSVFSTMYIISLIFFVALSRGRLCENVLERSSHHHVHAQRAGGRLLPGGQSRAARQQTQTGLGVSFSMKSSEGEWIQIVLCCGWEIECSDVAAVGNRLIALQPAVCEQTCRLKHHQSPAPLVPLLFSIWFMLWFLSLVCWGKNELSELFCLAET